MSTVRRTATLPLGPAWSLALFPKCSRPPFYSAQRVLLLLLWRSECENLAELNDLVTYY